MEGNRQALLKLLRRVNQSFPAWLAITVLDHELRVCRGHAGAVMPYPRARTTGATLHCS